MLANPIAAGGIVLVDVVVCPGFVPTTASAGVATIAAAGGVGDGGDGAMVAAAAARTEGIGSTVLGDPEQAKISTTSACIETPGRCSGEIQG